MHGLGAVLVQVNPNDKNDRKIVCFASRLLTEIETRYSQCEKEGIAAVWGCERFWMYLFGSSFTQVTDNRAIQLIFGNALSRPLARIKRWGLRLTQFEFKIVHRPEATNIADYFSRHPSDSASTIAREGQERTELCIKFILNQLVENELPAAITRDQVRAAILEDKKLALTNYTATGSIKDLPTSFKHVFDEISLTSDGILLRGCRVDHPRAFAQASSWFSAQQSPRDRQD